MREQGAQRERMRRFTMYTRDRSYELANMTFEYEGNDMVPKLARVRSRAEGKERVVR